PFTLGELNAYSNYIGIPIAAALVPYWTLCMEEHFYTVWPFVVKKAKSISALVAILCALEIATIVARCALNFVTQNFLWLDVPFQLYYMNTFCHLDPLVIGGLLAFAYHKHPAAFELSNRFGLALSAVLGVFITYLMTQLYHHFPTSDAMMVADMTINSIAAGLSFYLAMAWRPVRNLFALKTAGVLGRYCFAFYLVHNFVFALVEQQLYRFPLPDIQYSYFTLKCLIGFPVTFAISLLSWKYIESPFHRLKKNFERKAVNPA
ncbi:MAG: acyltransferase, partial [Cyanobacteria bacterium SZAS-4]|nr:acyltransferase [Cyanobacteria bacterium SZAS-4]